MKRLLVLLSISLIFTRCDKDSLDGIEVIVIEKGGCLSDSWVVRIVNPDVIQRSYICDDVPASYADNNCSNSIILSLPERLATPGKRLILSGIEEQPSCFSSTYPPRHVTVKRMQEK